MTYPQLNRGDRGEEVRHLQSLLNRVGAMLITDGDFGAATERGALYAQSIAGQKETGSADLSLWEWLKSQPEPFALLATDGVAFIAREETGGLAYYMAVTRWPHYPGLSSGITIGVGYDLRFNTESNLRELWGPHLPQETIRELAKDIGKPGSKKRTTELKRLGIEVPFGVAWAIFLEKILPQYYYDTETIYPSLSRLPDLCRSALVSIVFNRGNSLSGSRRTEMRAIQDILARADDNSHDKQKRKIILRYVEDQIVSMERLWASGSGVHKRRQAEANLWRTGIGNW